ncbi:ABC transporter transmembrane domain-containing protein [soil metagenome]
MARFDQPLPAQTTKVSGTRARRLLQRSLMLARPEWKSLTVGLFFLVIASSTSLIFPQAIRMLVDGALSGGKKGTVDGAALFMLVVGLVSAIASSVRYVLFIVAGERVVTRLRRDAYAKLIEQEIAFFDEHKTGDLSSRLASDTAVLQSAVSANISMFLRNAVAAAGGIAMLFYTSWRLTIVMLAVVPAIALGAVFYGRRVRKLSREVQDALGDAASIGEESLVGIRTVRAFTAERAEVKRYGDAIEKSFELAKKRTIMTGTFMGVGTAASLSAIALVMWYGGRLTSAGSMSVGELTSFLVYTMFVAFSLGALGELWADFMRAAGAAERVFEITDRVPKMTRGEGLRPDSAKGSVELDRVDFAYPARATVPVLVGLSLKIEVGQVVAVVGASGAGKSTIAGLLTRLYDPTGGVVRFDGHDLRDLDPEWLRGQVAVVPQEPLLFSTNIGDNIRYGRPGATDAEVGAAARTANAHDFIASFPNGYDTKVGERGVQLSGGQKQRVAIARAVLKDPRLLILDEATSALDAESEHLVHEALERLLHGRTTLVIAHRLSTVKNADRVVVLEGGKIVQQGTHSELIGETGLYRRLVERQFVAA